MPSHPVRVFLMSALICAHSYMIVLTCASLGPRHPMWCSLPSDPLMRSHHDMSPGLLCVNSQVRGSTTRSKNPLRVWLFSACGCAGVSTNTHAVPYEVLTFGWIAGLTCISHSGDFTFYTFALILWRWNDLALKGFVTI